MSDTKRIEELKARYNIACNEGLKVHVQDVAVAAIHLAESLAAELDAIRGAGDEKDKEVERLRGTIRLHDIAITRGRERDAALQRVKELEANEMREITMSTDYVIGWYYWCSTAYDSELKIFEYVGDDCFQIGDYRVYDIDMERVIGPIPMPEEPTDG